METFSPFGLLDKNYFAYQQKQAQTQYQLPLTNSSDFQPIQRPKSAQTNKSSNKILRPKSAASSRSSTALNKETKDSNANDLNKVIDSQANDIQVEEVEQFNWRAELRKLKGRQVTFDYLRKGKTNVWRETKAPNFSNEYIRNHIQKQVNDNERFRECLEREKKEENDLLKICIEEANEFSFLMGSGNSYLFANGNSIRKLKKGTDEKEGRSISAESFYTEHQQLLREYKAFIRKANPSKKSDKSSEKTSGMQSEKSEVIAQGNSFNEKETSKSHSNVHSSMPNGYQNQLHHLQIADIVPMTTAEDLLNELGRRKEIQSIQQKIIEEMTSEENRIELQILEIGQRGWNLR